MYIALRWPVFSRRRTFVRLPFVLTVIAGALLPSTAGCVTPEGCNALDSEDECEDGTYRCGPRGREYCVGSPCGSYWSSQSVRRGRSVLRSGRSPRRGVCRGSTLCRDERLRGQRPLW